MKFFNQDPSREAVNENQLIFATALIYSFSSRFTRKTA
jgi:hypothetical protein